MYYNDQTVVFLDGEWKKATDVWVTPFNQTLHYGTAVFEGIRSYATNDGTRVFKAEEHYERLHYSAQTMHLTLNYSVKELCQLTYELLERNNLSDAYIRPLVFSDVHMGLTPTAVSHVMLCAWKWDKYLGSKLLSVMTSSYQRPNPKSCHIEAKVSGHYVNSVLATQEAKSKGFDEALLLDQNGFVAEGPGANFFFEKKGHLYTAPLGNILPGITRATMFELCRELEIPLEVKLFTPDEVRGADSAFFTGTAAEVAGINSLDGVKFKLPWEDSLGHVLQNKYARRVAYNEYGNFALV